MICVFPKFPSCLRPDSTWLYIRDFIQSEVRDILSYSILVGQYTYCYSLSFVDGYFLLLHCTYILLQCTHCSIHIEIFITTTNLKARPAGKIQSICQVTGNDNQIHSSLQTTTVYYTSLLHVHTLLVLCEP